MEGRILKGIGGFYTVKGPDGQLYTLRAQGKLRRNRLTPMVGDQVEFTLGTGDENSWLARILPRKNCLIRPPVANVDKLVIVVSAGTPKADLLLADRLLLLCRQAGISPLVVINKADEDEETARDIAGQYAGGTDGVFVVSARSGEGVKELKAALKGTVHAFGGQSGVGKSTLINSLYALELTTGSLSDKIDRGKHTTRHTELIQVGEDTMVLDTPGFSLLELKLIEPEKLQELYPEFAPYMEDCRFTPCAHDREPDCAVKQAVEAGKISAQRHERYLILHQEMKERWKERYD